MKKYLLIVLAIALSNCSNQDTHEKDKNSKGEKSTSVPFLSFALIKSYPHDINSFTEGFLFNEGKLYESTGATEGLPQTRSLFGVVDLQSGKIDVKAELDREKYFGEGITFLNGKVYQLTYKTKIGFIYDAKSFKRLGEFTFPSEEGWGMTTDGKHLIMSDGTFELTYLDPVSLKLVKKVSVTENGCVKEMINELEYIKGYIYANIWTTNTIVKIDPANGNIIGKFDMTSLAQEAKSLNPRSMEMNGIAYDSISDGVFVTGKMWPKIYELKME